MTPSQVNVYVALAVGVITSVPLTAFTPDHDPVAVQEVAFKEVHVRDVVSPAVMVDDETLNVDVGLMGAGFTVTDNVFTASADPVIPLQVNV